MDASELTGLYHREDREAAGTQILTFMLSGEFYGIDILCVQEIRGWERVTRVPNSPDYVKGVINLRGAIVPIYDLRQRFDMAPQTYTKDTVVIVMRSEGSDRERSIGIVVDAVSDVLTVDTQHITRTPDFGLQVQTEGIRGLVTADSKMVILIDITRMLADDGCDQFALA